MLFLIGLGALLVIMATSGLFHLLAYDITNSVGLTNADMTAFLDQSFSQRNGHYIFTEDYGVIASYALGLNISDMRLNMPSVNAIGFHHFWGVNEHTTPTSPHVLHDRRGMPLRIPQNEEMAIQASAASNAEHEDIFLFIAPPTWSRQLTTGMQRITLKWTATATPGAYSWGALFPITFETTLKGGWYVVHGIEVSGTNLLAIQVNFPRMILGPGGRKYYPGTTALGGIGSLPIYYDMSWLGDWGAFHTFEPPQMMACATGTSTIALTGYMDVDYMGGSTPTNLALPTP